MPQDDEQKKMIRVDIPASTIKTGQQFAEMMQKFAQDYLARKAAQKAEKKPQ